MKRYSVKRLLSQLVRGRRRWCLANAWKTWKKVFVSRSCNSTEKNTFTKRWRQMEKTTGQSSRRLSLVKTFLTRWSNDSCRPESTGSLKFFYQLFVHVFWSSPPINIGAKYCLKIPYFWPFSIYFMILFKFARQGIEIKYKYQTGLKSCSNYCIWLW